MDAVAFNNSTKQMAIQKTIEDRHKEISVKIKRRLSKNNKTVILDTIQEQSIEESVQSKESVEEDFDKRVE